MISSGIIEPSSSPYASPITVVKKKDGTIRLCIDFRRLNSITELDAEPIPTLEELLTKIQGARFFSKLDLTKGYWQIPIREDCRHLTAFQTPRGLYQFVFMPFGLSTASSTFQRMMQRVLGKADFIASYFDDVMIFSKTWDDHVVHIRKTLELLENAGLTAKPAKACMGFTKVDFLGHTVSEGKVQPDNEKTQKITDLKQPTTKKEVKRVLGLLEYYRRFVPNYSQIAQPLTDLTRKAQPNKVKWTEECQNSLERLKGVLTSQPVLRVPNLDKPFVVQTDASNKAIAGVLLQEHHGTLLPCHYVSRKLLDREINYAIIEKEALAIIFSLGKFAKYLLMRPFFIQTDHNPLTFLKKNKSRNARLSRWALTLQQFTFTISHISGPSNIIADAFSRAY
ncbi:polyprotein [Elysia marginata]|uniref:Polyprotein n=1 Tax=Elysia marginata TaxID=1093978 RepID=A0AAV4H1C3_9GAST|nr:polyprotein [Elysia marginata]